MKKLLVILGLVLATVAHAESGVEYEIGSEKGKSASNNFATSVRNDWIAVTPFWDLEDGWDVSLKFEGARDQTPGASLENKIEARIRKSWELGAGWGAGLRVGLGEDFNQQSPVAAGQTQDFAYYLVEPRVTYEITSKATGVVSYRYRNAFKNQSEQLYFESNTAKIGVDYKVTDKDEIGFRFDDKFGAQEHSKGFEFTYARSF
jgi:hypothetical protein